jgi:hypothetical protein
LFGFSVTISRAREFNADLHTDGEVEMAHLIEHNCILAAYSMMIDLCARESERKSDMSEVQDVCLSLEADESRAENFFSFVDHCAP